MTSDLAVLEPGIAAVKAGVAARGGDPDALCFTGGVTIGPRDAELEQARRHVSDRTAVSEAQRDAATGESPSVVVSDLDGIVAQVEQAAAVGVTDMGLGAAWEEPSDFMRHLEWLGRDVLPALRAL